MDLSIITESRSELLAGHERGEACRQKLELDKLDTLEEVVKVEVPENISAITTSFVQGFFGKSFRYFDGSSERLLKHYDITDLGNNIQRDFRSGIDRLRIKHRLP